MAALRLAGASLAAAALLLATHVATAQGATTFRPVADAYVDASLPNRSFGGTKRLKVATASPALHSYLRFDVTGMGSVRRATLRLRSAVGDRHGFEVRGVADAGWPETITYRTAPAPSPTVSASSGPVAAGAWTAVDVTSLVAGAGPVGMALTPAPGTTRAEFSSRESGAAAPQLVVETEALPPPDVTAPAVVLTAPTVGATVSGIVALAADASDDRAVAQVEFLVDGAASATDTGAPFAAEWDTRTAGDGQHTLVARATDAAGNVATSDPVTVTVANAPADTTPPETSVADGPDGTQRSGIARFTFDASEPGSTFECMLDDRDWAPCASAAPLHVANGRHRLLVRATDPAGNVDPTPAGRTWWADALLQNGTFEASADGWREYGFAVPGWKGYRSDVSIVAGGISGMKARVTPQRGESFYSLYDAPRSVDATVAGRVYTARGQVRSDTPGTRVCLEVVERSPTAVVATRSGCVTTTASWQPFPEVALTAQGGNNLYTTISQGGAAAGDSFEVDGMELTDGSPTAVAPPADPGGDPRLLAFGDIAFCDSTGDEAVARLLDTLPGTIAMVGDVEQNNASAAEFAGCFAPTWDRHLWRTRPAVGDHEYRQPGAAPYWDVMGPSAGERGKGWYSYDLANWHIVVLNSNCAQIGGCGPGSEQYAWLEADLAANATSCIGAYFHHPRFSSGSVHGSIERVQPFWDALYRYGAEWVLGGNDANYQRFAPQSPSGERDPARGIRQFVVGTGGTMHYAVGAPLANTEVQSSGSFGALELTLGADAYGWRFVPQEGRAFSDSGSHACSPATPPADTTPPTVRLTEPTEGATLEGTTRVAAEAADDDAVDRVEFRAGDRTLATDTTAPYAADVDVSALPAGQHSLTAVAHDRSGNRAVSTPVGVTVSPAAPLPNLVANPGFEGGLSGWSGYRATLTRVTGGPEGTYAARAEYSTTGSSYSVITTPVASTPAGRVYSATASVRSTTGKRICLRLRETGSAGALGGAHTCVTATSAWQAFPVVRYTAVGGGRLDLYAYQDSPATGDFLELDAVRLTAG